ncbi:MAG TPA: hypothetical protein VK550_29380 [Polyangiaceae bacterium]|nr:hypothetical protein [Polyangiaceae bacterium]
MKVRVLAATRLEARADREPGTSNGVVLRGTLRDDVGAAVPNSHVSLSILGEGGRGPALPLPRAQRCGPGLAPDAHDPHIAPDEYVVDTDAAGSFCIRNDLLLKRGVVRLHFQGSAFFEPSTTDVAFDLGQPLAAVEFDPEPRVVSLDRPLYVQGLRIAALGLPRGDWHVTLRDEHQKVLGTAAVSDDGYARIEVRTEDLAGPGTGSLSAALDHVPLSVSATTHAVERHARVELDVDAGRAEGYPDEGIAVAVRARSVRGDVPTGVVEMTIGDQPVGAARVQAGKALVVARFGAGRAKMATAQLRYLPDTPWWEPGDPLPLTMHIRPPNPWRRAPLFLLALALAAWMARDSLRARLRMPRRSPKPSPAHEDGQEMQVVRPRKESGDWTGRVIDAHDGHPLDRAKVSIVVPVFPGARDGGDGVVVTTATSESGSFALPATSSRSDARLRVEAPLHATFEEPLPPPSELAIPLISRRRRLLDRLVQWSTREWGSGAPSDPTPGQVVARAAAEMTPGDVGKRERADRVKTWARELERTVFDRAPVDERAEGGVFLREPLPKGSYEDVATTAPDGGHPKKN